MDWQKCLVLYWETRDKCSFQTLVSLNLCVWAACGLVCFYFLFGSFVKWLSINNAHAADFLAGYFQNADIAKEGEKSACQTNSNSVIHCFLYCGAWRQLFMSYTVGPLYKNLERTEEFGSYYESVLELKLLF